MLADQNSLQLFTVTTTGGSMNITTSNLNNFQDIYSSTGQNVNGLLKMNCAIDSYNGGPVYSDRIYNSSPFFIGFLIAGIASLCNYPV
jgi:hypothetical protein